MLIEALEGVARGDIPRLAVFMPPGSAKSTYVSVLFIPWLMAQQRQANIIAASHTTELAEKWGRRVRNLVNEYAVVLGIEPAADSQAAGRWALTSGAEYYAAGVGTGIAGFRAKFGIIDDPIRSRQDADSELIRDRIWDWYINDFRTRLVPGAAEILIQTRWHEDDLAGRALNHSKWEVISLPAIAGPNDPLKRKVGEPLWDDDGYGYGSQLRELRSSTPARTWSALYQQQPAPDEGDYWKSDWIRTCTSIPPRETMNVYGGSDYAVTSGGGDWTVHAVVGVDPENRMYLLDLWRGQKASNIWIDAWCDLVCRWKPSFWAEEKGQIISGIGPFLESRAIEREAWTAREQFTSRGDKAIRAQSMRGRMAMRGLYVMADAPFLAEFRSELLSFPAGKHDDQVDAISLIGQLLDKISAGRKPTKEKVDRKDGYRAVQDDMPDDFGVKTL